MSGKEGIRGYIVQTMIAILESLQGDWKYIQVEPDTLNDKVDILWTANDSSENLYQVKSSITDFGKTEILNYLLDLYNENPSANSFCVILVGNASTTTKNYFKDIKKHNLDDFETRFLNLDSVKDKIIVNFYPLHLPTLEAAIITHIDRFLSSKKINVDLATKELIYGGLINQFLFFSTDGKKVSKSQFENKLLGWINFNYSKYLAKSNRDLYLSFYLTNFVDFEDSISKISLPSIDRFDLIKNLRKDALKLFEKINQYKIIKKEPKEETISTFSDIFKGIDLNAISRTFPEYKNEPVIISDYEINDLKEKCKKTLGIELDENFFYFGDLKESKNSLTFIPGQANIILNGTDNEKKKKEDYDDFEIKVESLFDIFIFWEKIQNLNILPIVFSNNSNSYENGLRIKLFIPKNVTVILPKEFPHPNRLDVLKVFNNPSNILTDYLKHQKDSKVNECYSSKFPKFIYEFESTFSLFGMSLSETKREKRIEQFYDIIEHVFDFKVFHDNPKFTILECEIEELSANETISLPSFIFYSCEGEFDIEYEINSKKLSEKIKGLLRVKN